MNSNLVCVDSIMVNAFVWTRVYGNAVQLVKLHILSFNRSYTCFPSTCYQYHLWFVLIKTSPRTFGFVWRGMCMCMTELTDNFLLVELFWFKKCLPSLFEACLCSQLCGRLAARWWSWYIVPSRSPGVVTSFITANKQHAYICLLLYIYFMLSSAYDNK